MIPLSSGSVPVPTFFCLPSTKHIHDDVMLSNFIPWALHVKFPSEWSIFPSLLFCFLLTDLHPWATHLNGNDLPLLLFDNLDVNLIFSDLCALCIQRDVPQILSLIILVERFWFKCFAPSILIPGCQIAFTQDLKERNSEDVFILSYCTTPSYKVRNTFLVLAMATHVTSVHVSHHKFV